MSEVTHSIVRKHARQTKYPNDRETLMTISNPAQVINFTALESTRFLNPHHDTLVIALYISNSFTKWILVDYGSSANVLFLDALGEMKIVESSITHKSIVFIGFSGEHKSKIKEISLPVRMSEPLHQIPCDGLPFYV